MVGSTPPGHGPRPGSVVQASPRRGGDGPRPGADSGWGLFIVDRLASRWGTDESGYWFELDGFERLETTIGVFLLGDLGGRSFMLAHHGKALGLPNHIFDVGHDVRCDHRELASVQPDRFVLGDRDGDHAVALGAAALAEDPEVLVR